jgi:hypothetical protein
MTQTQWPDYTTLSQRNKSERWKKNEEKQWLHSTYLYDRSTDSSIEPNPVKSRDYSIARNRTKDDRAEPLPLLCEVTGMNLGKEYCQDHRKHGDQVYLTPILKWKEIKF